MVSLKKFFNQESPEPDGYQRVLGVLSEGIALHAIAYEGAMRQAFQSSVRAAGRNMATASSDTEALIHCGELIHTIQAYHRATEQLIHSEANEKQAILSMVTSCLVRLSRGTEVAGSSLRSLEKQLEKANQLDDIRMIKAKIGTALTVLQDEASRQERFREDATVQVERTLAHPSALKGADVEFDAVTGLGNARAAESALRTMFESGRIVFPVAFFLERLDLINNRFGFESGDKVLAAFGQHLAQHMRNDEILFRWRGPSFVALLDRNGKADSVRAELKRISGAKFEHTLRVGQRDILLPLSCAAAVMPVSSESGYDELLTRINAFVAEQTARFAHPE